MSKEESASKKVDDLIRELESGRVYREEFSPKPKTSIDKNSIIALTIILATAMFTIFGVTALIIWAVKG